MCCIVGVFYFGFFKDDVVVVFGGFVDFGVRNDKEDVVGLLEGDLLDVLDVFEVEFFESFFGFVFGVGVEFDGGVGGDFGFVSDVEVFDGYGGVCGGGCFKDGLVIVL